MCELKRGFPPYYNDNSRLLILGSFPSVKSRQVEFFYGNKQNAFWGILASYFSRPLPQSTEEKKELLNYSQIALWDVVESCEIKGSSDVSIKNYKVADIPSLLAKTNIKTIFINGGTAKKIFDKYFPEIGAKVYYLPSTSPANTRLDRNIWYDALRTALE
jgi:hypoxanthine-DNA glycosylase